MINYIYILLGIIGLGFLVFIHELGHYIIARRVGMKVEVFSVGFGKPFFTFMFQGVRWQICYLFFGGFVKIAGMEKEGNIEPHLNKQGFFGAKPINRIKVALAGPLVNILFALFAFSLLFILGGRLKPFSEYTKIVGFVDPRSQVYEKGLRVGDTVASIDGTPYKGFHDLIYSSVLKKNKLVVDGDHINYLSAQHVPFSLDVSLYPHPQANKDFQTFGFLSPAMFLVYEPFPDGRMNPIPEGSPMYGSGIKPQDRIVWVDGETIFSVPQLQSIINRKTSLITLQRDEKILHLRVPRLLVKDLRLTPTQKAELTDWQYEANLKGDIKDSVFIPYEIDSHCTVLEPLSFVDDEAKQRPLILSTTMSSLDEPLKKGDQILAVDGVPLRNSFDLLKQIQKKRVQIIVDRSHSYVKGMTYQNQDEMFINSVNWKELNELTSKIGVSNTDHIGSLYKLSPVVPISKKDFPRTEKKQLIMDSREEVAQKKIEEIPDLKERKMVQQSYESYQNRLVLGIALQDKEVVYNPAPWTLFAQVVSEMFRTMGALFSGLLNPKWMSGPVGFVQIMQHGWSLGVKEALYWLGMISMGLGITNLLPIPVLDGGYICFALWEIASGKPIKAKIMERMIIPFVVLMVLFFIFVTYHDVMRVFQQIF